MELVKLDYDGAVAVITLNRPEAVNAINLALANALADRVQQIAVDGRARAVVLRAEGKMFSCGGDIGAMTEARTQGDNAAYERFFDTLVTALHLAVVRLRELPMPLIAAVDGAAAGAGMSLALACDLTLASPRAKFVPAYPGIGLTADGGLTWTLARAVGPRKAMQLLLENKPIGAEQAHEIGLVNEVIDAADFDAAVMEKAQAMASLPRQVVRELRQLLDQGSTHTFEQQLDLELASMCRLCTAADAAEGLKAFVERRVPVFSE